MERDIDLEHRTVGVRRNGELCRLDVGGVLNQEPQSVVQRQAPGDRQDQIGRGCEPGHSVGGGGGARTMVVAGGVEEKVEGDVDVVDARVGLVDQVAEVDSEGLWAGEEGGVTGDVLADGPDYAGGAGLSGAAAEELDAAEPDPEDAVELAALAGGGPLEDSARGDAAAAEPGARGAVGGGDGGLTVREAKVVLEDEGRADRFVASRERDGLRDLEESGGGEGRKPRRRRRRYRDLLIL